MKPMVYSGIFTWLQPIFSFLTDRHRDWHSNITETTNEMFSWPDPLQSITLWKPQCSSWELMHHLQLSASTKANHRDFPWGYGLRTFRALFLTNWNPVMLYTVQWQCSKMPWPFEDPCGWGETPEDHWLIFCMK